MRLLLLALCLVAGASAQDDPATGWISGTVTDAETGDALIGATVWLVGTAIGAVADLDGRFFVEVPVGTHAVRASYTGYEYVETTVTVGEGETVRFAPTLVAGEIIDCWTCTYRSVALPGVYAARVVSFVDQHEFCDPVRAGDHYAVDR
ncbi:carboxypeptidase-like regulatory domain-containing protein [Rubrivirga sp. IMCC43871]|uniref:carboxypeptidase-like regulatory domain-containing protein n=1 Tax=Rubrivirga sp. IMCC43871 TaxID=3391575 RepID=UPI00398FDAD3